MRRVVAVLVLAILLAQQASAFPASAQGFSADAKDAFCSLATWRSDRLNGALAMIEPSLASAAATTAKLSVPVPLAPIDFAGMRARIATLAAAVCTAATAERARTALKALVAGQKEIAAQLKAASERDREALEAAARSIKATLKIKMKDAVAAAKTRAKAQLDARRAELAKTFTGDELRARVRSAAQQVQARAREEVKAQARARARPDIDALKQIQTIRQTLAQRLKAYAAAGRDEWAKVRAQAQHDLAAGASARVTATCAAASGKLETAAQTSASVLRALRARADASSAVVLQALDAVSAYAVAITTAQAACASPSAQNAAKQVREALPAVRRAGERAREAVQAVRAKK